MTDFEELTDLASERLGGAVLLANDEFFAPKEALLKAHPPEWREGEYTERGKWMDGWETRRRRSPGYDWCILRLGAPGVVRGVVVDTRFFRGNFPESCSVEACAVDGLAAPERLLDAATQWTLLLPRSPLEGDSPNRFEIPATARATHLRLNIFPDGGVARLRVHGEVSPRWTRFARGGGEVELAGLENGGWVISCSDMFFGHRQNLILPGRSRFMGDGWETRRRRGPGHDWSIVRLAAPGVLHRVEIDTDHFRGNAPAHFTLEGMPAEAADADNPEADPDAVGLAEREADWRMILPATPLLPHARHSFEEGISAAGPLTHVRLNIFPDGGVARLRVFGTLASTVR
ncbi:MAG: allantoicase [Gemmatimonadota bacterium]|nr:allantoicase [Gemmatimonadota bacterium]